MFPLKTKYEVIVNAFFMISCFIVYMDSGRYLPLSFYSLTCPAGNVAYSPIKKAEFAIRKMLLKKDFYHCTYILTTP